MQIFIQNAKVQVFTEKADIEWLFTTHIPAYQEMIDSCIVVELYGNEDSPTLVRCFSRNHHHCPAFAVFTQNESGNLTLKMGA